MTNKHRSNADMMTAWQTPAGQLPLDRAATARDEQRDEV